ncbi:uncharacterized protein LOC115754677 [Rhodamnia argentea]|uniref:Uncharacterized protein LOC115754677 n=1 Tax=Rhodamnia argentea TaxID=178133 RepID=A0A8B8QTA4_9MYRT|nr:uncharacterized protein LOC115754677 [Rhodamnia argentea]
MNSFTHSHLLLQHSPTFLVPSTFSSPSSPLSRSLSKLRHDKAGGFRRSERERADQKGRRTWSGARVIAHGWFLPVDPWAPTVDSESIASQLFAFSLFPYLGFLYFVTKSKSAPGLTLFGFYFLLAFVGATIPAGIYAKVHYGTSLSNVDWLHGGAESLLTLTNLFIVLGLRRALRKAKETKESTTAGNLEEKSSV